MGIQLLFKKKNPHTSNHECPTLSRIINYTIEIVSCDSGVIGGEAKLLSDCLRTLFFSSQPYKGLLKMFLCMWWWTVWVSGWFLPRMWHTSVAVGCHMLVRIVFLHFGWFSANISINKYVKKSFWILFGHTFDICDCINVWKKNTSKTASWAPARGFSLMEHTELIKLNMR